MLGAVEHDGPTVRVSQRCHLDGDDAIVECFRFDSFEEGGPLWGHHDIRLRFNDTAAIPRQLAARGFGDIAILSDHGDKPASAASHVLLVRARRASSSRAAPPSQ